MFQKLIVLGRVVKDPEQINGGCRFSIAYNEKVKGVEKTTFFNCVAFGKSGENIVSYVRKGRLLLIEGKVSLDEYMDKNGIQKHSLNVMISSFSFVSDSKKENNENQFMQPQNQFDEAPRMKSNFLDDIPF